MIIASHPGTGTDIVADVLRKNGAHLQLVTNRSDAESVEFDGLILLGGSDISPFFYGQPSTYSYGANRERDIIEWVLVRRALSMQVPILGICRGHQMLAVACGGSLYQDITIETGASHDGRHRLGKVSNPLAKHLPTVHVNSLHHQAIKTMPPGFQVAALSIDGIVEAIWRPGLLGVQWHPELLYPANRQWSKLFRWFIAGLN